MIKLSEESQRLTSTFLTYRNDIDIYTEDEEKDKEFYRILFNRLLRSDIVINDITPLGSKSNVISRCQNEPENGRKKIFIIDGDITIIHGTNIPSLANLFVLNAYCIENFLFDKDTIIQFIYLSCATRSKQIISKEVDFENWLNGYSKVLIDLFIHFALCNYFGLNYKLFNAFKYHVKESNDYKFSTELVNNDIEIIKQDILKVVEIEKYEEKYHELQTNWTHCISNLLTIVSGKDYLVPILLIKTQLLKKSKALPTLEEVKVAMVQYSNLNRLKDLKEAIEAL